MCKSKTCNISLLKGLFICMRYANSIHTHAHTHANDVLLLDDTRRITVIKRNKLHLCKLS